MSYNEKLLKNTHIQHSPLDTYLRDNGDVAHVLAALHRLRHVQQQLL